MGTYNREKKPKMKTADLIVKMRNDKGILFKIQNEEEPEKFLLDRNNYLRTAAYRKNYSKHSDGLAKGKYIGLEFAYLTELSKLDMYLREILFHMTIDVEHALKTSLLREVESNDTEDGYQIVDGFLKKYSNIKSSIAYKAKNPFTYGLIKKYFKIDSDGSLQILDFDCPIWVLVELLSFGDFIHLYEFYDSKYPKSGRCFDKNILNPVRTLRNACGHNNCMLFDLRQKTHPPAKISQFVASMPKIGKKLRQKKLSYRPIFEICCLLYAEKEYVSETMRNYKLRVLHDFVCGRMQKHKEYFSKNDLISTTLDFLAKVVDTQV